jgi:hypothetical protein
MERRISLRKGLSFFVTGSDGTVHNRARSANLSPSGIQLVWIDPPTRPANQVLELRLYLPKIADPMVVRATVVWRDGAREGLSFVDIADVERLDLAEALDRTGS